MSGPLQDSRFSCSKFERTKEMLTNSERPCALKHCMFMYFQTHIRHPSQVTAAQPPGQWQHVARSRAVPTPRRIHPATRRSAPVGLRKLRASTEKISKILKGTPCKKTSAEPCSLHGAKHFRHFGRSHRFPGEASSQLGEKLSC